MIRNGFCRVLRRGLATARLPPPSTASRMTICVDLDETLLYSQIAESGTTHFKEEGSEGARQFSHDRRILVGRPADFEIDLPYLEQPVPVFKRPE
eukprot:7035119-Prymnesium_polylepis.1